MARKQYLICYDIADDKRRTVVFKTLMGQGDHVQYSVFLCALNDQERAALRGRLNQAIHQRDDQVIIVDLGQAAGCLDQLFECIGKPYDPIPRVRIV